MLRREFNDRRTGTMNIRTGLVKRVASGRVNTEVYIAWWCDDKRDWYCSEGILILTMWTTEDA